MDPRTALQPDYQPIFETTYLYWLSAAIRIATELEIASLLEHQPNTIDELTTSLKMKYPNLNANNLFRVMRDLSVVGIFTEDNNGRFHLAPDARDLLNTKTHQFILNLLSGSQWQQIATLSKENLVGFDNVFLQKLPDMSATLSKVVTAYRYSKALFLFTQLSIADLLLDKDMSNNDIASAVRVDDDKINILLELVYEKGILKKDNANNYSLTSAGKLLCADNPISLKHVPLHESILKWMAADNLIVAVSENKIPFKHAHGENIFQFINDPKKQETLKEELAIFSKAMAEISKIEIMAIVQHLEINSSTNTFMDVGGGTGALTRAILEAYPQLKGIIFDQAETIANINLRELPPNCQAIAGNFFDENTIPTVDTILLKRTLHDWEDQEAIMILKNCSKHCEELRIIEWLWKPTQFISCLDLFLMSIDGKIRSEDDFKKIFASARVEFIGNQELTPGVYAVRGKPNLRATSELQAEQSYNSLISSGGLFPPTRPSSPTNVAAASTPTFTPKND